MNASADARLVLVVDHEHIVRVRLRLLLEGAGFEVSTATDGLMALDLLKVLESPPNLMLVNLEMMLISGRGFMCRLRRHPQWSSIPVVALAPNQPPEVEGLVAQLPRDASDGDILSVVSRLSR